MRLGATATKEGVRFAVCSAHAMAMDVRLFDPDETIPMTRNGDVWDVMVAGRSVGTRYLFRAHGPWDPHSGHWFNSEKLLLDPYARELTAPLRWTESFQPDRPTIVQEMPRCVVSETRRPIEPLSATPWDRTVLYEAHVRGVTMQHPKIPPTVRGTFTGMAAKPVMRRLKRLGVTAVELLPIQAFIDDRFTVQRGLSNFWGYQPLCYFAPDPRYGTLSEFRQMVRSFHKAGIEIILDIVFNHTGEGDERGPSLCFRGLDNASYYRLNGGRYRDEAGTGNTLDLTQPAVQRLVMDALRFWAEQGVDGFRFDLAVTMGRGEGDFDPRATIFDMIRQDPLLRDLKLIAEPWDVEGYELGRFPPPFAEWNDRFRDDLRRFWRGERVVGAVAARMTASAEVFDHDRRAPWASINYITAHDGFTLADLVSYAGRHNDANGEDGHDGHPDNFSDNMGTEGPDPALADIRALRCRNLLASLLLAQGTPMILAGDEAGNSQQGNNNSYAQDNATGWVQWTSSALTDFVARLIRLRAEMPLLRQTRFLHGGDVSWHLPDGRIAQPADWEAMTALCMQIHGEGEALLLVLNPGPALPLALPEDRNWRLFLDTTQPDADLPERGVEAPAHSVLVFRHTD